jgi:GntR family transcriptional regulator/MocR family aminotransferase
MAQAVLCDFIVEGHFARHIRRMREVYAERLSTLLDCAARHLAGRLEVCRIEAGLQTPGWLSGGLATDVAAAAAQRQIEVSPIDACWRGRPAREGLLLGFAAIDLPEIRRGVADLAAVLDRA